MPFTGMAWPGEVAVAWLARLASVAAASPRPLVFVAEEPSWAPGARNGRKAYTLASVVISSSTYADPALTALQVPGTVISAITPLESVPLPATMPPVATAYKIELPSGHV